MEENILTATFSPLHSPFHTSPKRPLPINKDDHYIIFSLINMSCRIISCESVSRFTEDIHVPMTLTRDICLATLRWIKRGNPDPDPE